MYPLRSDHLRDQLLDDAVAKRGLAREVMEERSLRGVSPLQDLLERSALETVKVDLLLSDLEQPAPSWQRISRAHQYLHGDRPTGWSSRVTGRRLRMPTEESRRTARVYADARAAGAATVAEHLIARKGVLT